MNILIKEINNVDTIWYSEKYMEQQLKQAFEIGLSKGIRVDFHAVEPCDRELVDRLVAEFKNKIKEELNRCYENSEIIKRNLI